MAAALSTDTLEVAVIGTGFGGIGAGVRLLDEGVTSFVLLERSSEIGGTWRDNTYPGCACDIPSVLYSFSFAPNPEWTRHYPQQPEIERYLLSVVERSGLRSRIEFGFDVAEVRLDETAGVWSIRSVDGREVRAHSVISATGPLSRPSMPKIPGLDSFAGPLFHSAAWRHDVDLTGLRVGVIGTGASAIQFVPEIAPRAAHVTVFQRTAPWVLPREDSETSARRRALHRRLPWLQRLARWRVYLRQEMLGLAFHGRPRTRTRLAGKVREAVAEQIDAAITDPQLRRMVTPDYEPGCKRLLISNDWYPTLARDDVALVTSDIVSVTPTGVITRDGTTHEFDVLICGTGFAATEFLAPMRIFGRDGVELSEHWRDGARSVDGVAMHGFPDLWLLVGPNTGLGHNSIVFMIEAQLNLVLDALRHRGSSGDAPIEVSVRAETEWYEQVQQRLVDTVWTSGCASWYRSDDGRVDTLWPGSTIAYWWRTRRFDPSSMR